jgi:energy-converting hydrogenase Eha subunit B
MDFREKSWENRMKWISYHMMDFMGKWENHGILDGVLMGNAMTNIFIRISGNFSVGFFMGTQVSPSPVHMVSRLNGHGP